MSKQYLVWDLPIRLFHWSFVAVLLALWYTSDQDVGLIEVHMKLGYVALSLLLFRIIWGVVGTKHAKFINFIPRLSIVKKYITDMKSGKSKGHAGHNPLGSLMVILMLLLALLQAGSGLFINDDVFSSGPYYGVFGERMEQVFKFIHHNAFDALAIASVIHIVAVIYYVKIKKQPLITAMLHGKKPESVVSSDDKIKHSKLFIALIVACVVAVFVYWLVVINAPVIEEYYY